VLNKAGRSNGVQKAVFNGADLNPPLYDFAWFVALTGDARVEIKRVRTLFQCNPMALPGLLPGENKVRVTADSATKMAPGWALNLRYEWAEGEAWKTDNRFMRVIGKLPAEFAVNVDNSTGKLPRMKSLTLSVAPVVTDD
jgi:hypothetical protein